MAAAARSLVRADAVALARLPRAHVLEVSARSATHGMGASAAGQLAVSPWNREQGVGVCTCTSSAVACRFVHGGDETTHALPCAALAAPTVTERAPRARSRYRAAASSSVEVISDRARPRVASVPRMDAVHRVRACNLLAANMPATMLLFKTPSPVR